ncbi:MAG: sulfur carrier protein ThiS [Caulobacterales bacterium]|jgi:thiamine biosynthesis protein ThiS
MQRLSTKPPGSSTPGDRWAAREVVGSGGLAYVGPMANEILILVNGEDRRAPAQSTILSFLEHLGLNPARVAVERNREIVARSRFSDTGLADGDRIEIVQFVGGG